jgi:hypothetical protein
MGYRVCFPQATMSAKTQSQQRNYKREMALLKARNAYWALILTATAKKIVGRRKEGGTTYNPTSMAQRSYKIEMRSPVRRIQIRDGKAMTHVHGVTQRVRTP